MITNDTYHWLVGRCLQLELEIAVLKGMETPLPAIERKSLYDDPIPSSPGFRRARKQRAATATEIARMCDLRRLGRTLAHIADMTGFSDSTISRLTRGVLLEREVGR